MINIKEIAAVFAVLIIVSCGSNNSRNTETQKEPVKKEETPAVTGWEEIIPAVVDMESFDGDRTLERGQGFFVGEDIIATRYSMVNQADNIVIARVGSTQKYRITQYVAIDRINDIILLKTDSLKSKPLRLFRGNVPEGAKTLYLSVTPGRNAQMFSGKLFNLATVKGARLYRISNKIRPGNYGAPVFIESKEAIGIAFADIVSYETQSLVIPSSYLISLMESRLAEPRSLGSLRSGSSEQVAAGNRRIKGLVLETDMGNITIRLFNETPEYRDNFIKLVKENYYDSLLFHRIIKNFGIQSGAADTRHAEPGDIVGWKGPGYTLPAHIVPGLFHRRGMIGSPRKPDTQNQRRRADGSQFYIVSGRTYTDPELDVLEQENDYKFSPRQREVYRTIGGAPHLDGTYTVFGEVVSGMDVVDKMAAVDTNDKWRPLKDIRLKDVRILE